MDAIVPLLVLAYAVWSRVGRRVLRRDDVGRLVGETVARIRALEAGVRDAVPAPPVPPRAAVAPPVPAAPPAAAAPPAPAVRPVVAPERIPRERVAPRPVRAPDAAPAPAPAAPASAPVPEPVPAPAPVPGVAGTVRRRRLAVRRDLVATELLAAPVSLRPGGATWR